MTALTRRKALTAIAVAPAAVALPALAVQPDPIFVAIADHRALFRKAGRLWDALDRAEHDAEAVHGKRPWCQIGWREFSSIGDSEIDERLKWFKNGWRWKGADPAEIEAEYHDAKRRLREALKAGEEWDKRVGIAPLRKEYERASAAQRKAASQLAKTKPTTAAGAGALIAYVNRDIGEDHCCSWHGGALKNAAATLK